MMEAMVKAAKSPKSIKKTLTELRRALDPAFGADTAAEGYGTALPSSGQCAAAAVVVHEALGGELRSAKVKGRSHWFNRLTAKDADIDVDITGDQFGFPAVQVGQAGSLYDGTRTRVFDDLDDMTLCRARVLAQRAQLGDVVRTLDQALQARASERRPGLEKG